MKRRLKFIVLGFTGVVVSFLYLVGWFSASAPWQQTTGWSLLNEDLRPVAQREVDKSAPRIFWLGHAGILLDWNGVRILLDPILSLRCAIVPRLTELPIQATELPPIDAVLISHAHYDHLDNQTLEAIQSIGVVITPVGTEDFVSRSVLQRTTHIGLSPQGTYQLKDITITAVSAVHRGGRFHPFRSSYFANGYIVSRGTETIYFAGDTAWGSHFKFIRDTYHPTIAILPIGGFEPWFLLKHHHLSPEQAAKAGALLEVETTIPIHFGTYRVALESPEVALPRFVEASKALGLRWIMPELFTRADAQGML